MHTHIFLRGAAVACALCAVVACSQGASSPAATGGNVAQASATSGPSGGGDWTSNGATACDKYLTPDVVAGILTHPTGQSKKLSPQACTYDTADNAGSISITLSSAGPKTFDAYQQYLANPVPLAGVGDKASRSMTGIDAVKGNDRSCGIDAGGAPGSTKLTGEALAQKLGEICNKLFALP